MSDKIKIGGSFYADMFDDVDSQHIFQLSVKHSERIWAAYIDKWAGTYFKLPGDNWLIKSEEYRIGEWVDDFNRRFSAGIRDTLAEAVAWADEDAVWFCANRSTIFECSWRNFRFNWINFLYCHDDAPIIVNAKYESCAIVFYNNNIGLIDNRHSLSI